MPQDGKPAVFRHGKNRRVFMFDVPDNELEAFLERFNLKPKFGFIEPFKKFKRK